VEKYPINRKPVEKQGRKVMGLKLWKHSQDSQTAEDYTPGFLSRVWQKSDPFYLNLIKKKIVPTNRNPAEKQRRKAMGLNPFSHGHDCQVTENELSRF